jgi:pyrroline-5-carboxylate reductase
MNSIGFLGAGQMATALAKGWLKAGLIDPTSSFAFDPFPDSAAAFQKHTGLTVLNSNQDVARNVDLVVLAVKPQIIPSVLVEIEPFIRPESLVISIAAGVTLEKLAKGLGSKARIIRVMPNTPCLVNESASALAAGPNTTDKDKELALKLFVSVGLAVVVPEYQLDAVTGLSGSGPAYVYMMIEAMADGGVRAGLPRDVAMKLATQTVLGSAKMVQETYQHPGALKDAVASPGGTTIAGIHALEKGAFRATIIDAVVAATERSKELGKN